MMRIAIELAEGSRLPRGYGIAWHDHCNRQAIVLPLGLHWLAGALRAAYHWMCFAAISSVRDREYLELARFDEIANYRRWYQQGRSDGYQQAFSSTQNGSDRATIDEAAKIFIEPA